MAAEQLKVAGLALEAELDDGDSPLEALVCLKVMTGDGHMDWQVMATGGLHSVEGLGAAAFAVEYLKRAALGDGEE